MTDDDDIVAKAPQDADAPQELDPQDLDEMTGAAKYGGTNTCEPVRRAIPDTLITSVQTGGSSE